MVVLQWGLVIVEKSQWVSRLDQEFIVETSMLEVVHNGRPVASQVAGPKEGIGLEQAAVAQQHVSHLQDTCHMGTVVVGIRGVITLLNPVQVAAQLALIQLKLLDVAGLAEQVEG